MKLARIAPSIQVAMIFSLLSLAAFTFLTSAKASADATATATASVTVIDACTLSGTVDTPHSGTVPNGIYSGGNDYYPNGIGKTTLKVVCNDASGYAIYAVGYTDNTYGTTTLNGVNTGQTIATGTAVNGTTSNWAMKLTKITDTSISYQPTNLTIASGYSDYHAVPATSTQVATYSAATDVTLGSKIETTYAAYVSPTQPADLYQGKVKYTLVHPASAAPVAPVTNCGSGKICYVPNASGVTDSMGDQNVGTSATSATLWASNFKRSGYGFAGWSTTYDYSDPNGFYGPNEDIEFSALSSAGMPLYAIWVKSIGYLQNWSGCAGLSQGEVTALTDIRDDNTYAVAKLADGNCWMIENLRLDYDANITTSNTQSDNGAFGGVFAGLAQPETANFTATSGANDATTANSLYYAGTQVSPATINITQTNYAGYRMPRYRNDNTNTNSTINPNTTVSNMTGTGQNVYSYGNYYTWATAMANTNYYDSPTATDANNKTSETANTSLCPTGWNLPRGGDKTRIEGETSDFYALGLAIVGTAPANYSSSTTPYWTNNSNTEGTDASKAMRTYPNNFLYSGYAYTSSVDNRGSYGGYWSSTANNRYTSYYLRLNSSSVDPGTYGRNKYNGSSIRCLTTPPLYLQ